MNHRRKFAFASVLAAAALLLAGAARAQSKISPKWEELTAADFRAGIQQSKGTCVLPFGILEKHGPHLPLGTDLLNVRYASLQAVATQMMPAVSQQEKKAQLASAAERYDQRARAQYRFIC